MSNPGNAEAQAPAQESVVTEEKTVTETPAVEAEEGDGDEAETEEPETTEEGEVEGAAEGAEADAEGERPSKSRLRREAQKRKLTALEDENRRLTERLAEIERTKPPAAEATVKPKRDDYEDEAEYTADLAAFKVREAANAERARNYETDSAAARDDAAKGRMNLFRERAMALKDTHPDIEAKVFNDPTLPMSQVMAETIMESEKGPEIAYYLSANREQAQRIKSMSPLAAAKEIGRIEATLSLPKPRTQTQAPPPPKTLKGSVSGPQKHPKDMSHAEYRTWRKTQGLE